MSDLAAFLTARWDEEESLARAAAEPWESDSEGGWFAGLHEETIEHTARHNPAQVLVDLDAKRKILERAKYCDSNWGESDRADLADDEYRENVLPLLALPYAAHPDYRQEWAP